MKIRRTYTAPEKRLLGKRYSSRAVAAQAQDALLLWRLFEDSIQQALVTLISAYTAYLIANEVLQVSGVMAVLVTGLIMGRVIHNDFQDERGSFVDTFWSFNVYVAEALVFLLMEIGRAHV